MDKRVCLSELKEGQRTDGMDRAEGLERWMDEWKGECFEHTYPAGSS